LTPPGCPRCSASVVGAGAWCLIVRLLLGSANAASPPPPLVELALVGSWPDQAALEDLVRELLGRSGFLVVRARCETRGPACARVSIERLAPDRARLVITVAAAGAPLVRELSLPTASPAAAREAVAQALESSLQALLDSTGVEPEPEPEPEPAPVAPAKALLRASTPAPAARIQGTLGLLIDARWFGLDAGDAGQVGSALGFGLRGGAHQSHWEFWTTTEIQAPQSRGRNQTTLGAWGPIVRGGGAHRRGFGRLTGVIDVGLGIDCLRVTSETRIPALGGQTQTTAFSARWLIAPVGRIAGLVFIPSASSMSLMLGVALEIGRRETLYLFDDPSTGPPLFRWSTLRPTLTMGMFF
jgi:hypothetical protein